MEKTSISDFCDQVAVAVTVLKLRATELLEQLGELDAAARECLDDPRFDGRLASQSPCQQARDGLRAYLLDELHSLVGVPAPPREIYFVEGREIINGPALGSLPERVLPHLKKLEIRVAKAQARAAEGGKGVTA